MPNFIPEQVVDSALARLSDRRQAMSMVAANVFHRVLDPAAQGRQWAA